MSNFKIAGFPEKTFLITVGLIIIASGVIYALRYVPPSTPSQNIQNEDIAQTVRDTVSRFGDKLKFVSLLSPAEQFSRSMDENYGPFVAPELLVKWKSSPESAPGRTVSSPWPDRIDIVSVDPINTGTYEVHGNVIELTSQEVAGGGAAATYPVVIKIENRDGKWLITDFQKSAYSDTNTEDQGAQSDKTVKLTGTFACLPHRDTSGPQTLECAFGIKTDDGFYYSLDTSPLGNIVTYPTGTRLEVEGLNVPQDQINPGTWQKYDIKGMMRVVRVKAI
jgi:hypothetical protein